MLWFIFDALSNAPPTTASGAGLAEFGSILNLFHEELNFQVTLYFQRASSRRGVNVNATSPLLGHRSPQHRRKPAMLPEAGVKAEPLWVEADTEGAPAADMTDMDSS